MKKLCALLLGIFLLIGYSQAQIFLVMKHGVNYNLPWSVNEEYDDPYGSFRVDGGNFGSRWPTAVNFACVGKVNGLEDIKMPGKDSFASNVAIIEGYGYVLRCWTRFANGSGGYTSERGYYHDYSTEYRYCKIYVLSCIRNNVGDILSATIEYEYLQK